MNDFQYNIFKKPKLLPLPHEIRLEPLTNEHFPFLVRLYLKYMAKFYFVLIVYRIFNRRSIVYTFNSNMYMNTGKKGLSNLKNI